MNRPQLPRGGPSNRKSQPASWQDDDDGDLALIPLDLQRMLGVVRRHLRLVALVALLAAAAAGAYAYLRQPIYSANAVIRMRDTRASLTGGLAAGQEQPVGGPEVNPLLSLIEVLSSRTVAGAVVDSMPLLRVRTDGIPITALTGVEIAPGQGADTLRLSFTPQGVTLGEAPTAAPTAYGTPVGHDRFRVTVGTQPEATAAEITLIPREAAVNSVIGNLQVRARPNTDIVDVQFQADDPSVAQQVANRLVILFQDANAEDAQQESHSRRVFLEGQLREADSALAQAREAVASFRVRQRAFSAKERFTSQQTSAGQLAARRNELTTERQLYQQILQRMDDPDTPAGEAILALLSSPGLGENPAISQLSEQLARYQTQKDSLTSGPYGSAATNPDVTRLTALITTTQDRLGMAVRGAISVLEDRIAALDAQARSAPPSYQNLSTNESDEATLLEAVDAHRQRGDQLREEYQKARLAEAVQVGQVEIVDPAGTAAATGLAPRIIVIFGLIMGLAAGCGLAFMVEYLRPTIWRQQDLAGILDSENPIVIPRFSSGRHLFHAPRQRGAQALTMIGEPKGGTAEALRALRTKLIFSHDYANLKTLLITSTAESEGKSTMAANLAVAFAQQGVHVLLVDSDMRRANLHRMFGLERSPGLSTLLEGRADLAEVIQLTTVPNLSLVAAGNTPDNPAELLGGAGVRGTLDRMAAGFDLVLLDSPPVLAVADASILAAMTHGVLMVVRAGRAERDAIGAARDQLEEVGAHVVGAVLNDPDGEVVRSGGAYYFYGYDSTSR